MVANITIVILVLVLVIIISIFYKRNTKENFYAYYKDKQKIGWPARGETDNGRQPRSTWRQGDLNYETCYNTGDIAAANVPRTGTFFCDSMGKSEMTPIAGLYPIDFTNYNVSYQKIAKGVRLSGTFMADGSTYTFDEFGSPSSEHMTLKRSKEVCDALGTKCAGFVFQYPGKRDNYQARQTYFYASFEDGFEDPDTYDMKFKSLGDRNQNKSGLTSWYQFDTYRKVDPYYKEVPMKEIKVSGQDFERRICSVPQNPDYDLDYMSGTLDDCKARCATMENCKGFNRDANAKDDDVAACQFKKVSFDRKTLQCPTGFNVKVPGGQPNDCGAGWSWNCDENCARENCSRAGGNWIPKDYANNPYTCRMSDSAMKPLCENAPNRAGLVAYVRKQIPQTTPLGLNCPFPYQDAPKINFYLVKGNLYQPCKPILTIPDDSDLQSWFVDDQWYSVDRSANKIAEQIQDFVVYHLQNKPTGSKICARFNSHSGSPSNGCTLTAEKTGQGQYRTELYSQKGQLYSTSYWSKTCNFL